MQFSFGFLRFPLQHITLHLNHVTIAGMKTHGPLQLMNFTGESFIFHSLHFLRKFLYCSKTLLIRFCGILMKCVQLHDKLRHKIFLCLLLLLGLLIHKRTAIDFLCLLTKQPNRVAPFYFGLIIFVLPHIFFQNRLKFLHTVALFVELALHRIEKPFFHQSLLIAAIRKQIRQTRLFQIHFLDNRLPLFVIDLILHQFIKILAGLRGIIHVIIKKLHGTILLIALKHLLAGRKIFENHLLLSLFHNRQMMDVQKAWFPIFTDKIDHVQRILMVFSNFLIAAHHHSSQHITGSLIEFPLYQNKRRLARCEITFKRTILRIPVSLMHKRCRHHLHQHRFSSAVSQRQKRTLPVKVKALITDANRIVVIIDVNQTHCIDLTHLPSPPALAELFCNCSGSIDSNP